jgi:hypothetical protein
VLQVRDKPLVVYYLELLAVAAVAATIGARDATGAEPYPMRRPSGGQEC